MPCHPWTGSKYSLCIIPLYRGSSTQVFCKYRAPLQPPPCTLSCFPRSSFVIPALYRLPRAPTSVLPISSFNSNDPQHSSSFHRAHQLLGFQVSPLQLLRRPLSLTSSELSNDLVTPAHLPLPPTSRQATFESGRGLSPPHPRFFASSGHFTNLSRLSSISTGVPIHTWDLPLKSETQLCYLLDLKKSFNSNTEKGSSVFIPKCKAQIPHHWQ